MTKKKSGKRQEIKELINYLKTVYEDADLNLFKCSMNANIDTLLGYKEKGVRKSFLENYDKCENDIEKDK